MTNTLVPQARKLTVIAACALLAACGGGGGGESEGSEGRYQAISFKYPGGKSLSDGPTTLSATATSGLPVAFRSATPTVCTVAGDQVTLLTAKDCLIVASQPGGVGSDGTKWAAADDTSQLFVVLKRAQRPVVPVSILLRTASASVTLSDKTDGGLPATYMSTTPESCTVSGTTLKFNGPAAAASIAPSEGGADPISRQSSTQRRQDRKPRGPRRPRAGARAGTGPRRWASTGRA